MQPNSNSSPGKEGSSVISSVINCMTPISLAQWLCTAVPHVNLSGYESASTTWHVSGVLVVDPQ